jgi:hypothetical protein
MFQSQLVVKKWVKTKANIEKTRVDNSLLFWDIYVEIWKFKRVITNTKETNYTRKPFIVFYEKGWHFKIKFNIVQPSGMTEIFIFPAGIICSGQPSFPIFFLHIFKSRQRGVILLSYRWKILLSLFEFLYFFLGLGSRDVRWSVIPLWVSPSLPRLSRSLLTFFSVTNIKEIFFIR